MAEKRLSHLGSVIIGEIKGPPFADPARESEYIARSCQAFCRTLQTEKPRNPLFFNHGALQSGKKDRSKKEAVRTANLLQRVLYLSCRATSIQVL